MRIALAIIIAGTLIAGCNPNSGDTDTSTKADVAAVETMSDTVKFEELAEQSLFFATSPFDPDRFSVPEGLTFELNDQGAIVLPVGPENPSAGGQTEAIAVRLPGIVEQKASGKNVKVTLLTRALNADTGLARAAYSTRDVGSSGWIELNSSSKPTIASFTYDVPVIKNGNGDYLGLHAPNGGIVVEGISVSVD